ncbi:hypothetical protein [Glutamicibacter creatinolyticus]|uniref:hypothetical protein n=1 Tax=Glutamicibacter creatinolyticus TaxID=162496 RepID=UPI00321720A8
MTDNLDQLRTAVTVAKHNEKVSWHRWKKAEARADAAEAAVQRVRGVHIPHNAVMNPGSRHERLVKVCTGCGTDDGNWQIHPCPTIRAMDGGDNRG